MKLPRRRRIAVEVIQSSAMDCGPAALKSLLAGHGLPISYGRLREACQTDVDGTSIDTLEEVAVALGLEAEQVMVPVDHLFLAESESLPAIAVVLSPGGLAHFVVLWSQVAGLVQIMDPAAGRALIGREELVRRLFVHRAPVPTEALREWLGSEAFLAALRRRGRALGVAAKQCEAWISAAASEVGVEALARVDAALRLTAALVSSQALGRGAEATRFVAALLVDTAELAGEALYARLPESYFSVSPGPDAETMLLRGAVLVRVRGVRADAPALRPGAAVEGLAPDLVAALQEPPAQPLREVARRVGAEGVVRLVVIGVGLVVAAAAVTGEALVLRALLDVGDRLGAGTQRLAGAAALLGFFVALLVLEVALALGLRDVGRRLAARLRIAFLTGVARLGDRYLASRSISDMAERCHQGHVLRAAPEVAARLARGVGELVFTAAALIWLDPGGAGWVVLAAVTVLVIPLALQPWLVGHDLKVRSHAGALGRFYLDALLGLTALRTHAAERSLLREHEGLLVEWSQAQRGSLRVQVVATGISAAVGLGLAAALFAAYTARHAEPAGALLLLYWALALPAIGAQVAAAAYEVPGLRTTALRLLEPLHDEDEGEVASGRPLVGAAGVAVSLREVGVVAGGHTILHAIDLEIAAGEHVAIVGPSGAGKSSLLGLLLGFHRPSGGALAVDGRALDEATLAALREVTAWVDPGVQLWNETLLDNLRYGNTEAEPRLPRALERAELTAVLERLPDGLQSPLGEGGGLVSGGEGQRVRLGRALLRERPRLVLLDEPQRGLDRGTRAALLASSRAHWRGSTLLCVTHDIDAARGFDRVLVIEGGRVVEDGDPRALADDPSSRLAGLLRAEIELQREGWADPRWRRVGVEGGTLVSGAEGLT